MEFDDTYKVKIETLTKEQAIDFLRFLTIEEQRHWNEVDYADKMTCVMPHIANVWKSAAYRHRGDIDDIVVKRQRVEEMFKL